VDQSREEGEGEEGGRKRTRERTVNDVGVAGNPSDVGHATVAVFGVDIEDVFDGHERAEKVTSGRVNDTLGLFRRMEISGRREEIKEGEGAPFQWIRKCRG
jgi:hypothetical protein